MIDQASGEWLTRLSIWLAVAAWGVVMAHWLADRNWGRLARGIWTFGWFASVAHLVLAFVFFYEGSHARGIEETARQTEEVTGVRTGVGLWLNYLFCAWWGLDVLRWWRSGCGWIKGTGHWRTWVFQCFLAFMIFNGTVVFGHGVGQWVGGVLFVVLAGILLHAKLRGSQTSTD